LACIPQDIFYEIASFLDVRSISRILRLNLSLNRLEKDCKSGNFGGQAVFWHTIYMMRPPHKNPGFKLDKVDWRMLLQKKDAKDAE
jgi:hypothetical protein